MRNDKGAEAAEDIMTSRNHGKSTCASVIRLASRRLERVWNENNASDVVFDARCRGTRCTRKPGMLGCTLREVPEPVTAWQSA